MPAPIGRAMGLGVILSMDNKLSGPAAAASASMTTLNGITNRAIVTQQRFQTTMKTGIALMVGAGGAAIALGMLTAAAAGFETGMARVGAVLSPTTAEMNKLTASAINAGIATQFSPKQATEGLKDLATAGFTATESADTLLPVLDLATGSLGQLGVSGAATAASAAIRGFAFETKDASKVVDVLLRSTQLTNIQARDLQVMLARVSGNARAAGQEFEGTVAILGALRNTGAEASVSATTLRSALRAMTQTRATDEMQKLGVSLFDAEGNFRDLGPVIFDLNRKLMTLSERQRQASLMAIFGARGMNTFNAVVGLGENKFNALTMELQNASGTAAGFRKKVLEPLSGRLVLMVGSIQTLATQLGSPLLSPLKKAVTLFTKFLNFMIKLTQTFPFLTAIIMRTIGLAVFVAGLTGAILALTSALVLLNIRYGLVTKAKIAYFTITKLVFGAELFTRKQILLSLVAEKLRLTQQDLTNARLKVRIILEKILGISLARKNAITMQAVAAATAERIATLGSNVALGINNTLRKISNILTLQGIKGLFLSAKAGVMSSTAMTGASAATGLLTGAVRGLTVAMLANPILLIITGLILFTIAIVKLTKAYDNATGASKALFGTLLILISPIGALIVLGKTLASAYRRNLGGIKVAFEGMKKAIMSIFAPLGKLFAASEGGGGALGKLFSSILTLVLLPFSRAFQLIGKVATVVGAVIQIFVTEFEAAFVPLTKPIQELGGAFDALSVAIFGKGKSNLGFWKKFGVIIRAVTKTVLVPLAKVIAVIIKGITFLTKLISKAIGAIGSIAGKVSGALSAISGFGGGIIGGAASLISGIGGFIGLQHGGSTTKPTNARLSERGQTEVVTPLPSGMSPSDLRDILQSFRKGQGVGQQMGGGEIKIVIENRIFLDGREIQRNQREIEEIEELRDFGFNLGTT
jgi:TP901 family phage tail tape measure protein